eukprot:24374_1
MTIPTERSFAASASFGIFRTNDTHTEVVGLNRQVNIKWWCNRIASLSRKSTFALAGFSIEPIFIADLTEVHWPRLHIGLQ